MGGCGSCDRGACDSCCTTLWLSASMMVVLLSDDSMPQMTLIQLKVWWLAPAKANDFKQRQR